jgi:hypothetical protein
MLVSILKVMRKYNNFVLKSQMGSKLWKMLRLVLIEHGKLSERKYTF